MYKSYENPLEGAIKEMKRTQIINSDETFKNTSNISEI